jgi:hypothetical protein
MLISGFKNNRRKLFNYHREKLENPFFRKKASIIHFNGFKAKLAVFSVIIVLCFSFWFIFISSFWKINEISISGIGEATGNEIRSLIADQLNAKICLVIPQNRLLFFNEKKLQEKIKSLYRFQKVEIIKKIPNRLIINITEKPLSAAWNEGDKYYYVDTDGYVVQEINLLDIKEKKYPLIANESDERIYNSKIQVDVSYLGVASELSQKIAGRGSSIEIERFIISRGELDTLKIKTVAGPVISFDTKGDIGKQLDNLYILKTQKLKDDFDNKKTIDLRFGDKIYYQ